MWKYSKPTTVVEILKGALDRSIVKPNSTERSSSLAFTESGKKYLGVLVESDMNIVNITSEQTALTLSVLSRDFPIRQIITMYQGANQFALSPLILKVLIDYQSRTQKPLAYTVIDPNGLVLFETKDARQVFPLYDPPAINISQTKKNFSTNKKSLKLRPKEIPQVLRKYALQGVKRNFPLYESASGYGAAIYTKSGEIYFGGQYSSPDKRLGLHSEMTVFLSTLMDNATDITHIGLVSTKYKDTPCNMCGACRQFISDMSAKFKFDAQLHCFAYETGKELVHTIDHYLPYAWTSKKWLTPQ